MMLVILVGAFTFRVGIEHFLFPMEAEATDAEPSDYWQIATAVANGEGYSFYGKPSARLTPVYPLFLALYQGVFGSGLTVLAVIQSVVGCLTAYLVYRVGRLVFDARAGLLAAAGYGFHPYLARQDVGLLELNFFVCALVLVTWLLLRVRREPTMLRAAGAGGALALAYLVRPTVGAAAPLVAIWMICVVKPFRRAVVALAVIAVVGGIGVSPWVIRNAVVFDRLILSRSDGGQNLWFGNNAYFDEVYPLFSLDCIFPALVQKWRRHARETGEDPEDDLAMQAFAKELAREHIASDPGRFFRRALVKVRELYHWRMSPRYRRWWGHVKLKGEGRVEITLPREDGWRDAIGYSVPYVVMMGLALWGLLHVGGKWADVALFGTFIVSATLAYAVFFGTTKNRAALDVFFILLGAWGVVGGWRKGRLKG